MTISQVMSKTIVSVTPDTAFRQIWTTVFKKKINSIPVTDKQNKLVGVITREDLLKPLYPDVREVMESMENLTDFEEMENRLKDNKGLKAKDIMSKRVVFARTDTPIMRALSRMIARDVHQLPVLTDDDKLAGVVTKGDVFYTLFRKHFRKSRKNTANLKIATEGVSD